VHLKIL